MTTTKTIKSVDQIAYELWKRMLASPFISPQRKLQLEAWIAEYEQEEQLDKHQQTMMRVEQMKTEAHDYERMCEEMGYCDVLLLVTLGQ